MHAAPRAISFAALLIFVAAFIPSALRAQDTGTARVPVLVELFTSEGCSSCPPADAVLQKLDATQPVERVDAIVLSEHVDYWNGLGWPDPYSSRQFTQRQDAYAAKTVPAGGPYTPEAVVDGLAAIVGSDENGLRALIERSGQTQKPPLTVTSRMAGDVLRTTIRTPCLHRGATLFVALADDRDETHVLRGENGGRTLSHVAVVRYLSEGAAVSPGAVSTIVMTLPRSAIAAGTRVRIVAFLADANTGAVVAVGMAKLSV